MAETEYKFPYTAEEIKEKLDEVDDTIQFAPQELTEEQKTQARGNIGAASAAELSKVQKEIVNLNGGTPTTVSLVSEMVDTTKIYLYVGTEDGYTKGDWYYHNGTSWVRGGKYGGSASGTGWTSEQITLLETIGEYLVFTDASTGQAMFDSLIASLRKGASSGGGTTEPDNPETPDNPDEPDNPTAYTITNSFVNVTTDNDATSVEANASYTANLTANDGYAITTVTVTMGGVNVTDTVYAKGVITISEVTGNVVIIATANEALTLTFAKKYDSVSATLASGESLSWYYTCLYYLKDTFEEDTKLSITVTNNAESNVSPDFRGWAVGEVDTAPSNKLTKAEIYTTGGIASGGSLTFEYTVTAGKHLEVMFGSELGTIVATKN